jgi:hypothetical protein
MNGRKASRPGWPLQQLVRTDVGGRHDHDAALEQGLEQAAQDHGVGDVVDLEFVEAQQRRLRGDGVGERRDRVVAARVGALPGVDTRADVLHEAVEMDAPLAGDVGGAKNRSISMDLPRPTSPTR